MTRHSHDPERIRRILTRHAVGESFQQIGDAMGLTRGAVAGIVRRNRWQLEPITLTVKASPGDIEMMECKWVLDEVAATRLGRYITARDVIRHGRKVEPQPREQRQARSGE